MRARAAILLAGDDPNRKDRWRNRQVVIGSKLDASQAFLAHFVALWLEQSVPGLQCIARVPNGGSLKNLADLKYHWIDLYIEYTGTAYQLFNIDHRRKSSAELIGELNRFGHNIGIRCQSPLGASENYCLVIQRELAESENITTIEDLARVSSSLVFTADPEFLNRRDGFIGLSSAYDLNFRRVEACGVTDRYGMLERGDADVFVGYETDPEVQSAKLKVLHDPEEFFPDYEAFPVVSIQALESVIGLQSALDRLQACMTTPELSRVLQKLRNRGRHPAVIRELAEEFLRQKKSTGILTLENGDG